MRAKVTVRLKNGVLDPQGKAIEGALSAMDIDGVASVRQGKVFDIELDADSESQAQEILNAASEQLLANPVIENFEIELV